MHGGAMGSGAPRGNKNALKFGFYTREAIAERKRLRSLMCQSHKLLMQLTESAKRERSRTIEPEGLNARRARGWGDFPIRVSIQGSIRLDSNFSPEISRNLYIAACGAGDTMPTL